jgi:hypothetical protein
MRKFSNLLFDNCMAILLGRGDLAPDRSLRMRLLHPLIAGKAEGRLGNQE